MTIKLVSIDEGLDESFIDAVYLDEDGMTRMKRITDEETVKIIKELLYALQNK